MTPPPTILQRTDFLRLGSPDGDPPAREWHHFVIQQGGARVIINLSASSEVLAPGDPEPHPVHVPRVIVIVYGRRWLGVTSRHLPSEARLSADGNHLRIGRSRLHLVDDRYHLDLDLPEHGITGRLRLRPTVDPFVVNNQPLGTAGRLSWLAVAHLDASGWIDVGGERLGFDEAPAYHDHNWGRFRWGDGFGWEWGSVLPEGPEVGWSAVFMRMTDGHRHRAQSQGLYLWHDGRMAASFRDRELDVQHHGFLRAGPEATVPPVMALLTPGRASDIPAELVVDANGPAGWASLHVVPRHYVRVAIPSDTDHGQVVVLNEIVGDAWLVGRIGDRALEIEASGVFELLR